MPTVPTINLTPGNDTFTAAAGDSVIVGGAGDDTITTGAGNSSITTGDGNSTITAGAGDNVVETGDGNQTVTTGAGHSVVHTGTGNSTITTGAGNSIVTAGDGNNTITTGAGDSNVTTGDGDSTITVGAGTNVVDTGIGNNTVTAGAGNDTLIYHAAGNQNTLSTFDGGTGVDTLRLVLTRAEWMSDAVQTDVANYLKFLSEHAPAGSEADAVAFKFSAFGLSASSMSQLQVTVDGVSIDPANHTVVLADDAIVTAADTASQAINVLTNDSVPDLIKSLTHTDPSHGTVQFSADFSHTAAAPSAQFIYTPTAGFYDYLAAGETATDAFSYSVTDAAGVQKTASVLVTITGTNSDPVITAASVNGAVTEHVRPDGVLTSTGSVDFTDANLSDTHSVGAVTALGGSLGTLTAKVVFDTDHSTGLGGHVTWDYSVANSDVQYLPAGQTQVETFSFDVLDGHGGSAATTVSVTITGVNEAAVIGGVSTGAVTENTTLTTSGALTVTDVDTGEASFRTQTDSKGTYGNFSIDAQGHWSYALNNSAANVQALNSTDHVIDQFTVLSQDGTAQAVDISVNGLTKAAVVSGVIDFEGLTNYQPIPDGYKGFDWDVPNGMTLYALADNEIPGTGYQYGSIHPGTTVAFNPYALSPINIHKAAGGEFNFEKVYITGAWQVDQVTFEGFDHGKLVGTTGQMAISNTAPTLVDVHWAPIDDLRITVVGSHIVLDNFVMA